MRPHGERGPPARPRRTTTGSNRCDTKPRMGRNGAPRASAGAMRERARVATMPPLAASAIPATRRRGSRRMAEPSTVPVDGLPRPPGATSAGPVPDRGRGSRRIGRRPEGRNGRRRRAPRWSRWDGRRTMRARLIEFGVVEIDGRRYERDVVIVEGRVDRRRKKASRHLRDRYGHTPLSLAEQIPWHGRRLIVGTGVDGALPIEAEV